MKDEEIIDLYWKRDPEAVRETEASYGAKPNRLSFGILGSREDAEESVNDTYLKAWNSIPPQRPRFFFAYLAKICRFLSFDQLDWRGAKKRSAVVVELTEEMEQCIPDSRHEYAAQGEEIGRAISSFLWEQPKEERMLFLQRYWYGKSVRELAEETEMTESNVKVRLYRIRGRLKQYLESEGIWV